MAPRIALALAAVSIASLVLATSPAEAQRRRRGEPAQGTLVIQTEQSGAEVFVDEQPVGTTPLDPIPLAPGAHTLRVRMPGHTEYTDVVQIAAGQPSEVPVELLPLSQVLAVTTEPPGAHVYVDGDFMGEAPVEVDLLEGTRSVRIVLRGYHEVIREIEARAGAREEIQLTLEALPEGATTPDVTEWYEEPVTWIAVGGGAVAIAVTIAVIVAVTSSSSTSQADAFCASPGGCIRVPTW